MTHLRALFLAGLLVAAAGAGAAVAGHQLVHCVVEAGAFPSDYDGYAHVELIPVALLASFFCFLGTVFAIVDTAWAPAATSSLVDAAKSIARQQSGIIAALVVLIQAVVLLAMESTEQTLAFGHPLGGLSWLGGPWLLAILIHGCIAFASVRGLITMMRGIARICLAVRILLTTYIARLRFQSLGHPSRRYLMYPSRRFRIPARRLSKRGPPALA